MTQKTRTRYDVKLTLSIDKASSYADRSTLDDEIRSWLEGLGVRVLNTWIEAQKTGPRYPHDAKDVPANYVLAGDGYWYPHP